GREVGYVSAFTNCRGDEDIDAKRSRPSIGKPVLGHARKERVVLFGTDQRITSGPAAKRPHSKAEYMTAPERFADSQIPSDRPGRSICRNTSGNHLAFRKRQCQPGPTPLRRTNPTMRSHQKIDRR